MKKNIALIAGGDSGEHNISILSSNEIEKNIDPKLYNVYKIVLRGRDWYYKDKDGRIDVDKNDFSITINNKHIVFDAAFIIIHGSPGENGLLQGYLEMMGVPFTTPSSLVSALTFDKVICNSIVREFGVVELAQNLSVYEDTAVDTKAITNKLGLPIFVKPSQGGSSIGMSKVNHSEELMPAIQRALEEHSKVIIEEFIEGRELTCGVISTRDEVIAFPITEIITNNEFFDYEAKYEGNSEEITPANISDSLRDEIQLKSKELYKLLDCRGVVRFDYIYNESESKLFFLEVNTIPGQSQASIVPQQVREMGWTTKDLYSKLLEEIFR